MIRPLRKRHLWMWLVLMLVLPIGFFAAISVIPDSEIPEQKVQFEASAISTPLVMEHVEVALGLNFRFHASVDSLKRNQLVVEVKKTLDQPSSFIYIADEDVNEIARAQLVGSLGPRRRYQFELDTALDVQSLTTILLYDKIKDEVFHKATLSKSN